VQKKPCTSEYKYPLIYERKKGQQPAMALSSWPPTVLRFARDILMMMMMMMMDAGDFAV
jgi:hypothetical protein